MRAAGGQIDFKGLEDDGDAVLDGPDLFLNVRLEQLFRLTDDGGTHIDRGRMGDSVFARREHDGNAGIAFFNEIGFLGGVLLFVGGDGPDVEVVDLLIDVVVDLTGVAAALWLEDADGFAFSLDGAAIAVDGLDVFVVEDDSGGIFGVVGRVGLGG